MITSTKAHTFRLSQEQGRTLLTAQEYPWSVLQVVPSTAETFADVIAKCKSRGFVAVHDTDKTFCVIHLASGNHDGKHPEHYVEFNQDNYKQRLADLKDCMAQAAAWYYANVVAQGIPRYTASEKSGAHVL